MVEAGKLDRRIQFQRFTLADDGFGQVKTFANLGNPVSAGKRDVSDGERMRAGEVSAQITSRFHVRSSAFTRDLTPADQLVYEGRAYNIYGIKELEGRKRLLEITAGARVDK